jgi:hypothetical protein
LGVYFYGKLTDIHNYKQRLDRTSQRIKYSNEITEENKKIALNFKDYLLSEGIGVDKYDIYLYSQQIYIIQRELNFEL